MRSIHAWFSEPATCNPTQPASTSPYQTSPASLSPSRRNQCTSPALSVAPCILLLRDSLNSHTHFFRKSVPNGTPQNPAQFALPSICTASQTLPTQTAFPHRSPSSADVVPPHFQLFSNFQPRFLLPQIPAKIQGPATGPTPCIRDAPQRSNTRTPPRLPPTQPAPDSIRHIAMPSTSAAPPADRNRTGSAKDAHSAAAAR